MRKTRGMVLLLFVCIVLSACNGKKDASNTKSAEGATKATEDTRSTTNANTSQQNRLDELEEDHPSLQFTEAEETIAPGIESLPKEWQELTKYPATIVMHLENLHVINGDDDTDYSKILKENPEYIVPIVILIHEAYERLDRIDDNTPENVTELRQFCETLRQKGE